MWSTWWNYASDARLGIKIANVVERSEEQSDIPAAFGASWQRVWAAAIESSFLGFPKGIGGVFQMNMRELEVGGRQEGRGRSNEHSLEESAVWGVQNRRNSFSQDGMGGFEWFLLWSACVTSSSINRASWAWIRVEKELAKGAAVYKEDMVTN